LFMCNIISKVYDKVKTGNTETWRHVFACKAEDMIL